MELDISDAPYAFLEREAPASFVGRAVPFGRAVPCREEGGAAGGGAAASNPVGSTARAAPEKRPREGDDGLDMGTAVPSAPSAAPEKRPRDDGGADRATALTDEGVRLALVALTKGKCMRLRFNYVLLVRMVLRLGGLGAVDKLRGWAKLGRLMKIETSHAKKVYTQHFFDLEQEPRLLDAHKAAGDIPERCFDDDGVDSICIRCATHWRNDWSLLVHKSEAHLDPKDIEKMAALARNKRKGFSLASIAQNFDEATLRAFQKLLPEAIEKSSPSPPQTQPRAAPPPPPRPSPPAQAPRYAPSASAGAHATPVDIIDLCDDDPPQPPCVSWIDRAKAAQAEANQQRELLAAMPRPEIAPRVASPARSARMHTSFSLARPQEALPVAGPVTIARVPPEMWRCPHRRNSSTGGKVCPSCKYELKFFSREQIDERVALASAAQARTAQEQALARVRELASAGVEVSRACTHKEVLVEARAAAVARGDYFDLTVDEDRAWPATWLVKAEQAR